MGRDLTFHFIYLTQKEYENFITTQEKLDKQFNKSDKFRLNYEINDDYYMSDVYQFLKDGCSRNVDWNYHHTSGVVPSKKFKEMLRETPNEKTNAILKLIENEIENDECMVDYFDF